VSTLPADSCAPNCVHDFAVIDLRGTEEERSELVRQLRAGYADDFFVSEPYERRPGQWAFALCHFCKATPDSPAAPDLTTIR